MLVRRPSSLDTDISDTALGAILQQEQNGQLHVIGYASHTLTNVERHYRITSKELPNICWDSPSSSIQIVQPLRFL